MAEQAGMGVGRYLLRRRLGAGGMGSVWLADDPQLRRQVALKAITAGAGLSEAERGERIARARLEAEHAARLSHHPHVASVLDILEHDGLPWIVMEYVPGATDLAALVRAGGGLPDVEVARIGAAVLSALVAGHEIGIIHRDVKPDNILLAPDQAGRAHGRVSLTDYGISLHPDSPRLTQGIIGTPGYLAPERIRGGEPSPASDLFALGVTLYFAVQGEHAFQRDDGAVDFAAPLFVTPVPPRGADPALAAAIMGSLVKDPAQRMTAEACRPVLEDIAAGRTPSVPAAGAAEPTPEPPPGAGRPPASPSVPDPGAPTIVPVAARLRALRRPLTISAGALLTAGVITAAAVLWPDAGDGSGGTAGGGGDQPGGGAGNKVVTLAVDAPLTGELAPIGIGIKNSADLAVKQANKQHAVDGITFRLKALDDKARPETGQANADRLVRSDDVLGVVGPINTGVTASMQKVLDDADLATISPAAQDPSLTQGEDWWLGKKARPFESFYRVVPADDAQGIVGARYAYNDAKKKKAFVVDDRLTYGSNLANAFKGEFTRLGGKVVGEARADSDEKDFASLAAKVRKSGADMIYYGGTYTAAGPLRAELERAGADIQMVGGDGIYSPEFAELAGDAAEGSATTWMTPLEELASADRFRSNYKKAGYDDPYEFYGGHAYDATWALIRAIKTVVGDDGALPKTGARAAVVRALRHVSFDGVTGMVAFDKYGDRTDKQLTVYTVENGAWELRKRSTYSN